MNKIVILVLLGVFTGITGCMLQRYFPPAPPAERQQPHGRAAVGSKEDSAEKPRTDRRIEPRKGPDGGAAVQNEKQRSIPSLESRLARAGAGEAHIIHPVQAGETLSEIAKKHYGTYRKDLIERLRAVNGIQETDTVQAGWELIVPVMKIHGEKRPKLTAEGPPPADPAGEPAKEAMQPPAGMEGDAAGAPPPAPDAERESGEPPTGRFVEGLAALDRKDYPAAYEAFAAAAGAGSRCDACGDYLKEIEARAGRHFEKGLDLYRQREYAPAAQEFEKARIPPMRAQTSEYLFKSHFEIALKHFLEYQRSGNRSLYAQARTSLNQARRYRGECPACADYEEAFKKTHYNNGIKYFTGSDGDSMDNALREWERVRFIDPGYKDVAENILQAQALLKKLKKFKKVS